MLVAAAFLLAGAFGAWKYFQAGRAAVGTATTEPAKSIEPSAAAGQKTTIPPKIGPPASAPTGLRPPERKNLSPAEKAEIVEKNSLAAIYYAEGGCEKALPKYQEVLEIDPGNPRAYAAVQNVMPRQETA